MTKTKTEVKGITIREIVDQSIAFPVSKQFLLNECYRFLKKSAKDSKKSIKYELLQTYIFELNVSFTSSLAKSFITKADFEHIKEVAKNSKFADNKKDLAELVEFIEDWRTPEAQD